MANMRSVAEAKSKLEEIYMGIPDESVNLTFQDLANVSQNKDRAVEKKKSPLSAVAKGETGLQVYQAQNIRRPHPDRDQNHPVREHRLPPQKQESNDCRPLGTGNQSSPRIANKLREVDKGHSYDDFSSRASTPTRLDKSGRRRQGVPHSTICAVCSTNCYIIRTRCLVCGRAYCRRCLQKGMGEMMEGRKCIECLGLKFSHRYIQRAGKLGCSGWRYPSTVKQAELKWAERGPRRSGDRGYSHGGMSPTTPSRSSSPAMTSPKGYGSHEAYVTSSIYSPYMSPLQNHLPL